MRPDWLPPTEVSSMTGVFLTQIYGSRKLSRTFIYTGVSHPSTRLMTVWKTSNTPYGSTAVPREKKKEKGTNSVSSHSLTSMLMLLAILIVPSMVGF